MVVCGMPLDQGGSIGGVARNELSDPLCAGPEG